MADRPTSPADSAGPVELRVPARSSQLRMCRLVASGVAVACGLDVDQIDDLRIAVDELCSLLIEAAGDQQAELRLLVDGTAGEVTATGSLAVDGSAVLDPISQAILDGLDLRWSVDGASFGVVAPRRGGP